MSESQSPELDALETSGLHHGADWSSHVMNTEIVTQHTPGPWRIVQRRSGNRDHFFVAPTDHASVAILPFLEHDRDEQEKNARLIAAAPDMLEILKTTAGNIRSLGPAGALGPWGVYKKWLAVVEAAIAKAEGR